jgi:hypothetical protein
MTRVATLPQDSGPRIGRVGHQQLAEVGAAAGGDRAREAREPPGPSPSLREPLHGQQGLRRSGSMASSIRARGASQPRPGRGPRAGGPGELQSSQRRVQFSTPGPRFGIKAASLCWAHAVTPRQGLPIRCSIRSTRPAHATRAGGQEDAGPLAGTARNVVNKGGSGDRSLSRIYRPHLGGREGKPGATSNAFAFVRS